MRPTCEISRVLQSLKLKAQTCALPLKGNLASLPTCREPTPILSLDSLNHYTQREGHIRTSCVSKRGQKVLPNIVVHVAQPVSISKTMVSTTGIGPHINRQLYLTDINQKRITTANLKGLQNLQLVRLRRVLRLCRVAASSA